ncbi:MAG: ATP-binding cassette domain-containing protein [Leptospira sp.]|nr:ATP-binding cassette domain-containing protein [Leptospira sp.]
MNLISIDKLSKKIGDKFLFKEISFGVDDNDKIAFIGVNGSGKSTLLKIILGSVEIDSGRIVKNNNLRIGYLGQSPEFIPSNTILEHIFQSDSPSLKVIKRYENVCIALETDHSEIITQEYDMAMSEMDRLGVWEYEQFIKSILSELGLKNLNEKMANLSGGMLKKVALVQTIIDDTNFLILDEPTNHLDIDTILWLQQYLMKTDKPFLIVTHDRYFLDSVVEKIYEIDDSTLKRYPGNYSFYLEKKAEEEALLKESEQKTKGFLRKELEWFGRQPKARGTKQKARSDRITDLLSRKKTGKDINLEFSVAGRRLGKKILELKNVSKSFESKIIDNFSYVFKFQERIGIVGPNGAGKSTLLNLLTEREKPDSGSVNVGISTKFGYFDQSSLELNPDVRVIDFIKENAGQSIQMSNGEVRTASQMLELFLFDGRLQNSKIGKLSGGEKRRLYLVYILIQNPNFLLLDEPTNDLDIRTLSILEEFLGEFPGCIVAVSHDRYFMDRLCDFLLVFKGNGVIETFAGNYSDYLEYKEYSESAERRSNAMEKSDNLKNQAVPSVEKKKGLSFRDKKELETIEKEISEIEIEKKTLAELLSSGRGQYIEQTKAGDRLKELEEIEQRKLRKWEELSEK